MISPTAPTAMANEKARPTSIDAVLGIDMPSRALLGKRGSGGSFVILVPPSRGSLPGRYLDSSGSP